MKTTKETPAKPKQRKLGALHGKIIIKHDAFTPAEMRPYLKAVRKADTKPETGR